MESFIYLIIIIRLLQFVIDMITLSFNYIILYSLTGYKNPSQKLSKELSKNSIRYLEFPNVPIVLFNHIIKNLLFHCYVKKNFLFEFSWTHKDVEQISLFTFAVASGEKSWRGTNSHGIVVFNRFAHPRKRKGRGAGKKSEGRLILSPQDAA